VLGCPVPPSGRRQAGPTAQQSTLRRTLGTARAVATSPTTARHPGNISVDLDLHLMLHPVRLRDVQNLSAVWTSPPYVLTRHFSATAPSLPTEESAANPALSDLRSLLIRDLPTSLTVGESAKYISKRRQIFQCVPRQYEHDIDGPS